MKGAMELSSYLLHRYFLRRLNLRKRTQQEMLLIASRFSDWLGRPAMVSDLNEVNILRYLASLSDGSPSTTRSRRGTLLTIWNAAYKSDKALCSGNPKDADIPMPMKLKKQPRAWSTADIERMLKQAQDTVPRTQKWFASRHWTALILLIFHTGLRIMAVLQLKRSNLQGHLLYVPAEIQKDREEMVIPLPNHVVNMLVALSRPAIKVHGRSINEYLIPWPWSFLHPTSQFKTYILKPAGLPCDDPKLKFHAIRRTTASIIAAKHGKEAARDALGHSSLAVTAGYIVPPELIDPQLVVKPNPIKSLPHLGATG